MYSLLKLLVDVVCVLRLFLSGDQSFKQATNSPRQDRQILWKIFLVIRYQNLCLWSFLMKGFLAIC